MEAKTILIKERGLIDETNELNKKLDEKWLPSVEITYLIKNKQLELENLHWRSKLENNLQFPKCQGHCIVLF